MKIEQGDFNAGVLDKIRHLFPHHEDRDVNFVPEDRPDDPSTRYCIVDFKVGNYLHKFRFWQRIVQ